MSQCPEVRGVLRCTHDHPHPGHSCDFWPDQDLIDAAPEGATRYPKSKRAASEEDTDGR